MNGLLIIYMIGALAIGFLAGIIVELIIDSDTITQLRKQNDRLRLEKAYLMKHGQTETIEIVDKTFDLDNIPTFDQDW